MCNDCCERRNAAKRAIARDFDRNLGFSKKNSRRRNLSLELARDRAKIHAARFAQLDYLYDVYRSARTVMNVGMLLDVRLRVISVRNFRKKNRRRRPRRNFSFEIARDRAKYIPHDRRENLKVP